MWDIDPRAEIAKAIARVQRYRRVNSRCLSASSHRGQFAIPSTRQDRQHMLSVVMPRRRRWRVRPGKRASTAGRAPDFSESLALVCRAQADWGCSPAAAQGKSSMYDDSPRPRVFLRQQCTSFRRMTDHPVASGRHSSLDLVCVSCRCSAPVCPRRSAGHPTKE